MAAIGKIREKSGLLIAIIGIALAAFVLGDLFKSSGKGPETTIVSVDGEKINYQDFSRQYDKNLQNYKRNYQTNSLSQEQTFGLYNNTLDNMVKTQIMNEEYALLGIDVSADELFDQICGEQPHEWVVSSFPDGKGGLDREQLQNYLSNLSNFPIEQQNLWVEFENALREDRLNTKFNNLVKASFHVPQKFAEYYYNEKNTTATAEVVALRYSKIADSLIVVDEKDKKQFYEEHKARYQTDETREIEYVVFEVKPSTEDYANSNKMVSELKADFTTTDNVANFVNANSDKRYDSSWLSPKQLPAALENVVFNSGNEIGYVYGPYLDNGSYNLAKIVDFSNRADSLMASHILISYQGAYNSTSTITKERAQQLADSLLKVVDKSKSSDLFAELASKFSTDPSVANNKGDLGWFTDGMMVTPFNEFVMNNAVGTVGKVETPFGIHIVKVTGKTAMNRKARVAILTHEITPSTKTYQEQFAVVNKFVTENKTMEDFNAAVERDGLSKRTMPRMRKSTSQITGINNPRQIVRWAFNENTEVGDVSEIFDLDDMFVVAVLTKAIPEGYAPYEAVVEQAKYQILNKKKGEYAVEKMKAYGKDYAKMVAELGAEIDTLSNINFELRGLGNYGIESEVLGTIFSLEPGQVSEPIAGNSTAFIITNVTKNVAPTTADYSNTLRDKNSQYSNRVMNNGVYNALRNKAEIVDNRTNFY